MSDSKGECLYEHSSKETKKALLGMLAVNDYAESSFAGVSTQVQVFGRIELANAATISDMKRNGLLYRETTVEEE